MKKSICFFLLFSVLSIGMKSQTSGIQAPAIIPKSPEVMGLERYGEYPVSEYTGIPSINIPLYTIKVKDLEFPISLDYHASGIQVTQEATWVGLGWNLLAGGCISISAVGAIDALYGSSYASSSDWDYMLNYSYTNGYWQAVGLPDGIPVPFPSTDIPHILNPLSFGAFIGNNDRTDLKMAREASMGSGERDIYNVSFLGQSFKFSLHPTTGAYIYNGEKNKYKIEKVGDSWLITDELGYQYLFKDTDREMIYFAGQSNKPQMSWFLSQIVYQGNELVKINYSRGAPVQKLPALAESCDYYNNAKYRVYRFATYTDAYTPLYVSTVITPLDSIVFTTGSRIDMRGAVSLQGMRVFDRSSKALQKRYEFRYDYFTGTTTGVDVSIAKPDYVMKRLKLTEVVQWDKDGVKSSKYTLAYNESTPLPSKISFSQDLWGYYNGYANAFSGSFTPSGGTEFYSNANTLLPTTSLLMNEEIVAPGPQNFTGANRSVNKNVISAGILNSITYPTGGKTVFEFEPHVLGNVVYPTDQSFASGSCQIGNNGYSSYYPGAQKYQFEVERAIQKANVSVTIAGKNYDVTKMGEFYVTLTTASGSSSAKTYKYAITTDAQKTQFNQSKIVTITDQVDLPVGRVEFSTHIDPALPNPYNYALDNGVTGSLSYSYIKSDAETLGGGLRIKKITNYTDNNTIASVKQYKYITKDGKPSGKLVHPMKFTDKYQTTEKVDPLTSSSLFDRINSSNVWNYSTSGSEAIVGYDRVEVQYFSLDGKNTTGKKIVEFNNSTILPASSGWSFFIPYNKTASILNGKIASSTVLNSNNDTISVEKYTYTVENLVKNFINIRQMEWLYTESAGAMSFGTAILPVLMVYPTTNYTTHLMKKEETDYFGTNKVNITTDFEYDPLSYNVKKQTETIDNSKKKITEYQYGIENSLLLAKNMVSVPIKETVSMNTAPIQIRTMNYATSINSGFGMALTNVSIQNGTNAAESRLKYENYDKFGNPMYIIKDNADNVVYIWGYNYQYPIAEIKNCTYAQLTAIITAADLDIIAKKPVPAAADMDRINNLRDNAALKDAHITTFWYSPSVGLLQIKDAAKKDVYFEYDSFNRLKSKYIIENNVKKIVEGYDYFLKQ